MQNDKNEEDEEGTKRENFTWNATRFTGLRQGKLNERCKDEKHNQSVVDRSTDRRADQRIDQREPTNQLSESKQATGEWDKAKLKGKSKQVEES